MGRLWCSLYISGYKDAALVTTGPYSLCRHPLYLFSLIGFSGIGLATRSLTLTILVVGAFLLTYPSVIRREETFLLSKFGSDFEAYAAHTPRLIPRFAHRDEPEEPGLPQSVPPHHARCRVVRLGRRAPRRHSSHSGTPADPAALAADLTAYDERSPERFTLASCWSPVKWRTSAAPAFDTLMFSVATPGSVQASTACNLCGNTSVTVVSTRGRDGAPLRTVACKDCGLVWVDPRPHDTRQFYEDDYRRAYKHTFEPRPKHVLRAGRVALERLSRSRGHLRPGMIVLDVGSGGGEFCFLLTKLGHTVIGIEPNVGYAEYSRREYGLDIRRGFIGDVQLEPSSHDLVTIWHVLEHTENPGAVLTRVRDTLVPGGLLVVEVPNIEATCQSPRNTFHAAHLHHFNVATLEQLARRCGFRLLRHELSADGGNLTMFFNATEKVGAAANEGIPGNHDRVTGVLAKHLPWCHLIRPATGLRTLHRSVGQDLGGAVGPHEAAGVEWKSVAEPCVRRGSEAREGYKVVWGSP